MSLNNQAFGDSNTGGEAGAILTKLANRMIGRTLDEGDYYILYDSNGAQVGKAEVIDETKER
jgi:hypothetical protein